jgi:hypothetical protein
MEVGCKNTGPLSFERLQVVWLYEHSSDTCHATIRALSDWLISIRSELSSKPN